MGLITAYSPVTGESLGDFRTPEPTEIDAIMSRARRAQPSWGATPVRERLAAVRRLKALLVDEKDHLVAELGRATGKPPLEALTGDIFVTLDTIAFYESDAEKILADEKRKSPLLYLLSSFQVQYHPIGVVAIYAPWNYPMQLAMVPAITALIAGNAVILKPSEVTASVGALVADLFQRADFPRDVIQVVQGGPDVGQALIAARPDKIFFTGSVATGRKVMQAAAEHLIPVELELGGKDPMVVFADANLPRAVQGAVYGAFCNAGQVCVSVERLYVERPIYDDFVASVVDATRALRTGSGRDADVGPIISPPQLGKIQAHVDDAVAKGALLLTQVERQGSFYAPVVLAGVNHSMAVMTEETFGPVLPIMPFDTEDEVVRLCNDTVYGLNASVWTQDLRRGQRIAERIITGSCAINDVIKNMANPHMPFGGEKHSGFGRYHGKEGLRSFSRQLSLMTNRGLLRREVNWFPFKEATYQLVSALTGALYGTGTPLHRSKELLHELYDMVASRR